MHYKEIKIRIITLNEAIKKETDEKKIILLYEIMEGLTDKLLQELARVM